MDSSSEDYATVEELEQNFSHKIALLKDCAALKGVGQENSGIFQRFAEDVKELCGEFLQIKSLVKQSKYRLTELKTLLKRMESLNNRLDHIQSNIPSALKPVVVETTTTNREKNTAANTAITPKPTKKVIEPTKVMPLTLDEFKNIPNYMKGRLKYEQINAFIETFNKVIAAKYKLLSVPRKQLKQGEYKKVQEMKLQETDETKNCYFCTEDNMKEFGSITIDKSTKTLFSILRHCKRLKEVRGPATILRYVIL